MIRSRKGCCEFFCSFICFISDPTRIPAIAAGVGAGMVIFANRAGGYYKARIANQIPFEKVLRGNPHCAFSVNFGCFPFWYQENVSDITSSIVLDCALKEAYLGSTLMNDCMSGEFPVLKPGMNAISWTGAVTKVVVQPNGRYL